MIIRQLPSAPEIDFKNSDLFVFQRNCPICNSSAIIPAFTSHDNHYGVSGEYQHYECKSCMAFFLNPMPTEQFLSGAYPTDYYAYQEIQNESRIKTLLKKIFFQEWKTKDPDFSVPGIMLDIGCGSGDFLFQMHRRGWKTFGVEPSENAARIGNQYPGLHIHNGTLLTAEYPDQYFDYIRSNHSLEHIPNPHETVREISRILKKGGKLFIGVPNTRSTTFNLFKDNWWNLGAPQHPINYNEPSLTSLVVPYGFKVHSVRTNSPYIGLVGSWQIRLNNKHHKKSDQGSALNLLPLRFISGILTKFIDLRGKGDCLEMIFIKD
jgi:SAM-dependent methyltransferase